MWRSDAWFARKRGHTLRVGDRMSWCSFLLIRRSRWPPRRRPLWFVRLPEELPYWYAPYIGYLWSPSEILTPTKAIILMFSWHHVSVCIYASVNSSRAHVHSPPHPHHHLRPELAPGHTRKSYLLSEYCNADCTTWKLTLQDINTTMNSKQSGIVAIDSCFALFGARKYGVTTQKTLVKNIHALWFK